VIAACWLLEWLLGSPFGEVSHVHGLWVRLLQVPDVPARVAQLLPARDAQMVLFLP
jgi:hypothetical protein